MSKPIKILHVFARMGRGGAEMRTVEILRHLDQKRYQFNFCVLSGRRGELDDEVRALGGEVYPVPRGAPRFGRRFRELLRQLQCDVVCSHVLYYSGIILGLAAQCNVPVRVAQFRNTHDGRRPTLGRRLLRALMRRRIDRYATDIVAVSEAVMERIWGPRWRTDPRCTVIYNGVETSAFERAADRQGVRREFDLSPNAPLCVHVGRMVEQKNHLRLISIFHEVCKRQPAARLLLVGQGANEIERRVRRRMVELGAQKHVILCGQRSDVPRLLKAADVLVFPSLWEGLPGAVLEACLAGTPVVASDLPGTREIAARLSGIRLLALDASDRQWASAIETELAERKPDAFRDEARRAFAASVFTVERCAQMNRRIWQKLVPEPAMGGAIDG